MQLLSTRSSSEMASLQRAQCDHPLTNRGSKSQRLGFAESKPPADLDTIPEKTGPWARGLTHELDSNQLDLKGRG